MNTLSLIEEARIYNGLKTISLTSDFPGGSDGKTSVYNVGDRGSIPGLGRSTGEGNGNPLQYYCLENPMDRGAYSPWDCKELDTTNQLHYFPFGFFSNLLVI